MKKIEELIENAKNGNSDAQYELGNYYYEDEVEKDYKKAVELYEKSANQGNLDASDALGNYYYELGKKCTDPVFETIKEEYYKKSLEYFLCRKEPKDNNVVCIKVCCSELLKMYKENDEKVKELCKKILEFNSSEILLAIGEDFEIGYESNINLKIAFDFYKKAAQITKKNIDGYYNMIYFCIKYKEEVENSDEIIQEYVNKIYESKKMMKSCYQSLNELLGD